MIAALRFDSYRDGLQGNARHMPPLDWIGKKAVVTYHRDVPCRLIHCDRTKFAGDPDAGNLLVQGDGFTGPRVVYADGGKVPDDRLFDLGLTFKQIPHQIEGL